MSDMELTAVTITQYVDLLRIKQAPNRDAEIETQERRLRVILEAMGIKVDEIKVAQ